jgi:GNAT superfamily N-acetyltransferase
MTVRDIPAGLRLCRLSRWNQLEDDWALFLRLSPHGCRVAEKHSHIVGSVATLRYQDRFSWLSMVLVDPAERGAGIGTRLLEEGLAVLRDEGCVRLDATPLGQPLYEKHGFVKEFSLSRMTSIVDVDLLLPAPARVRRMREKDLAAVFDWDRHVFGADRQVLLEQWFRDARDYAWLAEDAGILGYCFGRKGHLYDQLGPIVAKHENIASELISACLRNQNRRRFALDTPTESPAWMARLASFGFEEERPFARMRRGPLRHTGGSEYLFGIAGPEFG